MQLFTLAPRSLHLPVGGHFISFEMFMCSLSFSSILELGSYSSGLSDSTFLIFSSAVLHRRMLFFVIQSHTVCSHEQFKYLELLFFRALSLTKIYWKPTIRFISFPGSPDYQDATYQLIIFSIGQWTTSLPQYTSFLSFGFFGSLLLRVLLLGRVYHFVAMP